METKPKQKNEDTLAEIGDKAKDMLHQGNMRRFVVRTADGNTLVDVSLTVAIAVALGVLFLVPGGFMMTAIITVIGIVARVRVEILRELDDADDVIELPRDES